MYFLSFVIALVLIWFLHNNIQIKKEIKIHIILGLGLTILNPNIACILFGTIYGYYWFRNNLLTESLNNKLDNLLGKFKRVSDFYYNHKKEKCHCEHYCSCVKK